jgi:hypothetical protein
MNNDNQHQFFTLCFAEVMRVVPPVFAKVNSGTGLLRQRSANLQSYDIAFETKENTNIFGYIFRWRMVAWIDAEYCNKCIFSIFLSISMAFKITQLRVSRRNQICESTINMHGSFVS